jgi:hypothetical protein
MSGIRCDAVMTAGRGCHAPLEERIDHLGRIHWTCPRCEARKAGRCWKCNRRRENPHHLAIFCNACRDESLRQAKAAWLSEPINQLKQARTAAVYRKRPEVKARKMELLEQFKAKHPEKKAEYAAKARARYHERKAADPEYVARRQAQRRARFAADPERHERDRERRRIKYWEKKLAGDS